MLPRDAVPVGAEGGDEDPEFVTKQSIAESNRDIAQAIVGRPENEQATEAAQEILEAEQRIRPWIKKISGDV